MTCKHQFEQKSEPVTLNTPDGDIPSLKGRYFVGGVEVSSKEYGKALLEHSEGCLGDMKAAELARETLKEHYGE